MSTIKLINTGDRYILDVPIFYWEYRLMTMYSLNLNFQQRVSLANIVIVSLFIWLLSITKSNEIRFVVLYAKNVESDNVGLTHYLNRF